MIAKDEEEKYEDQADSIIIRAGKVALLVIVLLLGASQVEACERCGLFGNRCALRQHHIQVQQVLAAPVIYPQVNYFVGAPIRVEAIVQQALRNDPEYAAFQQFKLWRQGQPSALHKPADSIPEPIPASLLVAKCGACHGGDAPKKGLVLDGITKLSCQQALLCMQRINAGTMPPKDHPQLTPEEKGDLFQELLGLAESK